MSIQSNLSPSRLSQIPELTNVPLDQLRWLIDQSSVYTLEAGDFLFKKGDQIDHLYILLEGKVVLKLEQAGDYKTVNTLGTNAITGYLPFSRAQSAVGYGECINSCIILACEKAVVAALPKQHYELTEALIHIMTDRTRDFTQVNLQAEKLMALGKLSAGLAHELNNPAAAMVSSAKELKKQLGQVPEKFKRLMSLNATAEEVEVINNILFSKLNGDRIQLSLLDRTDREEEIEDWLDDHNVDNAYRLTESLVHYNFDIQDLKQIAEAAGGNFPSAIEWIENVLTTEIIVEEIQAASQRISGIISSIKNYSHMDRGQDKQPMDIHASTQDTITILQHKFKRKNIEVTNDIAIDLAQPLVIIGEINQVWTNMIDNAIDAVDKDGQIRLYATENIDSISTFISDNGHGIKQEDLSKIFDPFFTTKKIGEGTGLGLDVCYRIIKQHKGDIKVQSSDKGTTFEVLLPITKTNE